MKKQSKAVRPTKTMGNNHGRKDNPKRKIGLFFFWMIVIVVILVATNSVLNISAHKRHDQQILLTAELAKNLPPCGTRPPEVSEKLWNLYQPVELYVENMFCGRGTVINRGKKRLITAAHVFQAALPPLYYGYSYMRPEVANPVDGRKFPLASAEWFYSRDINYIGDVYTNDIAVCQPDSPKRIEGLWSRPRDDAWTTIIARVDPFPVVSLVTGKTVQAIAAFWNVAIDHHPTPNGFYITYKGRPGESGTGFLGPEGMLLVYSGEFNEKDSEETIALLQERGVDSEAVSGPLGLVYLAYQKTGIE